MGTYKKCKTCGSWHRDSDMLKPNVCSAGCQAQYARCENCGAYFESKNRESVYCSDECEKQYEHIHKGGKTLKIKEIQNDENSDPGSTGSR